MLDVVRRTAEGIYMPLTVGGGIRSIDDIRTLLRAGADKVSLNTAALARPELISEAAQRFGSQCIVVAIDAKREPGEPLHWGVYTHGGRRPAGRDAVQWAREVEDLGAGEILLTSMDRDGTGDGYDLELTRAVSEARLGAGHRLGRRGHAGSLARGRGRGQGGCRAGRLHVPLRPSHHRGGQGLPERSAACRGEDRAVSALAGAQVGRPGAHPGRRPGNGDGRGADGGVDGPRGAREDARDRARPLLVPLAPRSLAQGRDVGPRVSTSTASMPTAMATPCSSRCIRTAWPATRARAPASSRGSATARRRGPRGAGPAMLEVLERVLASRGRSSARPAPIPRDSSSGGRRRSAGRSARRRPKW